MTQMMPPEIARYGYVKARVIRTIGDTTDDADEYPDAVGATGTIVFTPLVQRRRTSDYEAFVLHEPVTCTLDSGGVMHGPSGAVGVWLLAGDYLVKVVTAPAGWDDFTITVTVEHTVAAPLNLATPARADTGAGADGRPAWGDAGPALDPGRAGVDPAAVDRPGRVRAPGGRARWLFVSDGRSVTDE